MLRLCNRFQAGVLDECRSRFINIERVGEIFWGL